MTQTLMERPSGTPDPAESPEQDAPRHLEVRPSGSDRVFGVVAKLSGLVVFVIMVMVGVFLAFRALQAIKVAQWSFLWVQNWDPDAGKGHFGIAAVMVGTVLIGVTAIVFAMPLALGTALYISEYAHARLKSALISIVDLMAAVPSIVFGLWGFFFLQPHIVGLAHWISKYFGWIPIFKVSGVNPNDPLATASVYTSSTFICGVVVCLMVTPIATSVMREVFSQAPLGEREGAFALGATRWGMIRSVVIPYGRGGIIGGTMLGLGRALGETIAVFLIISPIFVIQPHILQNGGSSISSLIALRYGDSSALGTSALMAAGLALFVMTMVLNFVASSIAMRSRSGATSEA